MPADKSISKPTGEIAVDHPIEPKPGETTPAQTTDKPEAKKKEKPLSKESLDGIAAFLNSEFPGTKIGPPKQPDDDKKKSTEDDDKEKVKDGDLPKETAKRKQPFKPKPVPKVEAPPALTAEQVATAAAKGTTEALTARQTAAEKEKKAEEPTASPADLRRIEVLKHMETMFPEDKGVADKYARSLKTRDEYSAKWQSEHPGETFDQDSPEHEDFFERNTPDCDDDHYTEALADLLVERRLASVKGETQQEVAALKKKLALQESQASIAAQQNTHASQFWGKCGDDFKDIVAPNGIVNHAKLEELKKTDPEATGMRLQAAVALDTEVSEIYKLYNGLTDNNPKGNAVHAEINRFVGATEQAIASKPMQDRVDAQGRDFLPAAKYWNLTKAERERHWTLTADDVCALRSNHLSKLVNRQIEAAEAQHRAWAKAKGIELPEPTPRRGVPPTPAPDEEDAEETGVVKPRSPSSASDSRAAASRGGKPEAPAGAGLLKSIM